MEAYQTFILHLAIFAATGVAISVARLAAGYGRAISLILELRRIKTPSPMKPVFVDAQPAFLRMRQVAIDIFKRDESAGSVRKDF